MEGGLEKYGKCVGVWGDMRKCGEVGKCRERSAEVWESGWMWGGEGWKNVGRGAGV